MNRIDLCGTWQFYDEEGKCHQGTVPGCVHTDLFSMNDMFWEKNSEKCQFIEKQDWTYVKEFQIDEIRENMELEHVYVFTDNIDSYSAQIKITEHFRGFETGSLVKTEVFSPQGEIVHRNEFWCQEEESVLYCDIENPKLWYPHTYGEQPLYTLRITVGEQVTCQKFGIRTVKILQLKDKDERIIKKCKELQQTASTGKLLWKAFGSQSDFQRLRKMRNHIVCFVMNIQLRNNRGHLRFD